VLTFPPGAMKIPHNIQNSAWFFPPVLTFVPAIIFKTVLTITFILIIYLRKEVCHRKTFSFCVIPFKEYLLHLYYVPRQALQVGRKIQLIHSLCLHIWLDKIPHSHLGFPLSDKNLSGHSFPMIVL
jgi:hypothetical protein